MHGNHSLVGFSRSVAELAGEASLLDESGHQPQSPQQRQDPVHDRESGWLRTGPQVDLQHLEGRGRPLC